MKRRITTALVLVGSLIACRRVHTSGPYTVQLQEGRTTLIDARRADGSTVRVMRLSDGNVRRTIHFANGTYIDTHSGVNLKTTRIHDPRDPRVIAQQKIRRDPASNCLKNYLGRSASTAPVTVGGMEKVTGYRAMKVTTHVGYVVTAWHAPDLGCEIIKQHVDFGHGQTSDQVATLLKQGEPDSSLFAISPDYKEASPLEVALAVARFSRHDPSYQLDPKTIAQLSRAEQTYQQFRPR